MLYFVYVEMMSIAGQPHLDPKLYLYPQNAYSYKVVGDTGEIFISGEINFKSEQTVEHAFAEFDEKNITKVVIHLNSPGGDVDLGMQIGSIMTNAEDAGMSVTTEVDHYSWCASMCTNIFAMGSIRATTGDSVWVFHSPYHGVRFLPAWASSILAPFLNGGLEEPRKASIEMLSHADEEWAHGELTKVIYDNNHKSLWIMGRDMPAHGKTFVTKFLK